MFLGLLFLAVSFIGFNDNEELLDSLSDTQRFSLMNYGKKRYDVPEGTYEIGNTPFTVLNTSSSSWFAVTNNEQFDIKQIEVDEDIADALLQEGYNVMPPSEEVDTFLLIHAVYTKAGLYGSEKEIDGYIQESFFTVFNVKTKDMVRLGGLEGQPLPENVRRSPHDLDVVAPRAEMKNVLKLLKSRLKQ